MWLMCCKDDRIFKCVLTPAWRKHFLLYSPLELLVACSWPDVYHRPFCRLFRDRWSQFTYLPIYAATYWRLHGSCLRVKPSLEPRLSVLDFVSQLWRKSAKQNRNGKPGSRVRSCGHLPAPEREQNFPLKRKIGTRTIVISNRLLGQSESAWWKAKWFAEPNRSPGEDVERCLSKESAKERAVGSAGSDSECQQVDHWNYATNGHSTITGLD